MTHYSDDPKMVQVNFFKPNGKWKYTEAFKTTIYECSYRDSVAASLEHHLRGENGMLRMHGLVAVVIDPHALYSFPRMFYVYKDRVGSCPFDYDDE